MQKLTSTYILYTHASRSLQSDTRVGRSLNVSGERQWLQHQQLSPRWFVVKPQLYSNSIVRQFAFCSTYDLCVGCYCAHAIVSCHVVTNSINLQPLVDLHTDHIVKNRYML